MMTLIRLAPADAQELLALQKRGFQDIYEKYQDHETSPVNEPLERLTAKLEQPFTFFYRIVVDGAAVGAIRIVDKRDGSLKRISPLFILPEHRGKGYAQEAILALEALHGDTGWDLETIAQEPRNIHLYEKMGYRPSGKITVINERMTIIGYTK